MNVLINEEGWDVVRCDDNNTPFSIPNKEKFFIEKAIGLYKEETEDIANLISEIGFKEIFSAGCGCGFLEYNLKKINPELIVKATDFNSKSIERLKSVFKLCDSIETFNILTDNYRSSDDLLYLFFRIDTEIHDAEWLNVFRRMHTDKARYILIVATEFLTFERFIKETIKGVLRGIKGYTFCGYIRTKDSFEALWGDYYKIVKLLKIGSLNGYLLKINK
ncbi:hypothetical protein [Sinanaerobacter chloroacetimidivorans]|uniref:Methyltransferase domain-containing protein n=1 Tax=Sinanaerobacter chloroacetimidivorans TaxID=2818044 RepID=A0A8J8B387_9FIRM|nr:hypothetical protein [Sinanaerobacter chloroacetimidivorans]MBR0599531.1 hypothetical protein [Sinanaerobacter chloroacetimidivorans]